MGPSVKNLLTQYKLDPNQIASTGPHQTLLKSDVLSFINKRNLEPGNENALSEIRSEAGPEGFSRIAKELLHV